VLRVGLVVEEGRWRKVGEGGVGVGFGSRGDGL
jgi:hypothetical protein